MREVPPRGVEEAAEERRPHHRELLGERVGDPHGAAARIVRVEAQEVEHLGRDEAPGDRLVEAHVAHRVLEPAAERLAAAEPAALAVSGQGPRQLVEAVEAPDLLDQVDLARDVEVALGRDLGAEVVAFAHDSEAEPRQVLLRLGGVDRDAEDRLGPLGAERDHVRRGRLGRLVDRARARAWRPSSRR